MFLLFLPASVFLFFSSFFYLGVSVLRETGWGGGMSDFLTSDRGQVNHLWEQSGGLASQERGERPRFASFYEFQ